MNWETNTRLRLASRYTRCKFLTDAATPLVVMSSLGGARTPNANSTQCSQGGHPSKY